jgi:hypothetical protein
MFKNKKTFQNLKLLIILQKMLVPASVFIKSMCYFLSIINYDVFQGEPCIQMRWV